MPRGNGPTERTCIVTRRTKPVDRLIRFVQAPDGDVVPDLRRRLPGRGVWVTASREAVDAAERKRLFARGFRAEVRVAPGLAARVERLIEEAALASLSMTRKAGCVVAGFAKVEAALGRDTVVALIAAAEAADDGMRKIAAAVRRRFGAADAVPVIRAFASAQLDLALGRPNVIHAALLEGRASDGFMTRAEQLAGYRDGAAGTETTWTTAR